MRALDKMSYGSYAVHLLSCPLSLHEVKSRFLHWFLSYNPEKNSTDGRRDKLPTTCSLFGEHKNSCYNNQCTTVYENAESMEF